MKILKFLKFVFISFRNQIFCKFSLGYYDSSWSLIGLPVVKRFKGSKIHIGSGFKACSSIKCNSLGVFQPVILKTLSTKASLIIENNVGISGASVSCLNSIKIGNNVLIGSGVIITDNDAHPIKYWERSNDTKINVNPVVISDNVFIGARSIILKGVKIGHGSVIGAGSVVTTDVPPMSIFAGNPAKLIREIK